jgi:hypothetical protein
MREGSCNATSSPGRGAESGRAATRCYTEGLERERTRRGTSLLVPAVRGITGEG